MNESSVNTTALFRVLVDMSATALLFAVVFVAIGGIIDVAIWLIYGRAAVPTGLFGFCAVIGAIIGLYSWAMDEQ